MKIYNDLWNDICTILNFEQAYKNAIKGKRYYSEVKNIEHYGVEKYLLELLQEVKEGRYRVSDYTVIYRNTGGKDREIYKLPMKDRIVQHALMIYMEPIFRESFIVDTFSSIKTRGIHFGMKRIKKAIKDDEYKYVLLLDIRKCYPSLNHDILKQKLFKKFLDENLKNLLTLIIESCNEGVPIGNYTSQYFNNFYFNDFDHWLKEKMKVKYYFRYCDDMLIFGKTKEELRELLSKIKLQINLLKVLLKPNYRIYPKNIGVNFLGFIFFKNHIRIRKRTKLNFIRKCKNINFNKVSKKEFNVLASYWGIFKHADCRNLWGKYTNSKTLLNITN